VLNDAEYQTGVGIRNAHTAEVKRIQADPGLSLAGRRAALARSHQHHQQRITALIAQAEARRGSEAAGCERVLFRGSAATLLADRDARAYVAAQITTPADARRELAAAERSGDESLARAVFAAAFDRIGASDLGDHWASVCDALLGSRPKEAAAAHALLNLRDTDMPTIMERSLLALPRPQEIAGGSLQQYIDAGEAPQDGAA